MGSATNDQLRQLGLVELTSEYYRVMFDADDNAFWPAGGQVENEDAVDALLLKTAQPYVLVGAQLSLRIPDFVNYAFYTGFVTKTVPISGFIPDPSGGVRVADITPIVSSDVILMAQAAVGRPGTGEVRGNPVGSASWKAPDKAGYFFDAGSELRLSLRFQGLTIDGNIPSSNYSHATAFLIIEKYVLTETYE